MCCNTLQNSNNVALRKVNDDDLITILQWRNHPDVRYWMFEQEEISLVNHLNWYEKQKYNLNVHLRIFMLQEQAQGFINMRHISNGKYEWGFYLSPQCPRGQGKVLGKLALQWAFVDLGAQIVQGQVLGFNVRSLALHQKLGFKQDCILRKKHHEVIVFSLKRSEFKY